MKLSLACQVRGRGELKIAQHDTVSFCFISFQDHTDTALCRPLDIGKTCICLLSDLRALAA